MVVFVRRSGHNRTVHGQGVPAASQGAAADWYPDPYQTGQWRWWDGHYWSAHVSDSDPNHKPKLPSFISIPVLVAAIPILLLVALFAFLSPLSIILGLVPILIVFPVMAWLDRIEPEPWASRIHAVLWGATVSALISIIINTLVAAVSSESIAAVFSAPIVEETTKGAGILWAVKRREVDSVMDGIVYAGWVALGFAVLEDFLYFSTAAEEGLLIQTFILRAVLTPFAHPLFTAWIGLAVGLAIVRQKPIITGSLWGLALAIGTHMAWNGSLTLAEQNDQPLIILVAIALFILLFIAAVVAVIRIRAAEQQTFHRLIPFMAQRYGMSYEEVAAFETWGSMKGLRRQLRGADKKRFDAVHLALARLSQLHDRKGELDVATEARLANQLETARRS